MQEKLVYLIIKNTYLLLRLLVKNNIRSPFFYVGDKYKIMPQIVKFFPEKINNYYEPFLGGGSSVMHTKANKYFLNDINKSVIDLHKCLSSYSKNKNLLLNNLFKLIKKYKLSCSYLSIRVPDELKKKYVKTYYSKFNKESYIELRNDYNKKNDNLKLYLLLIYGFNHMIRFNQQGKFNLPVGNVDFNKNVYQALITYLEFVDDKKIEFSNNDYIDFIKKIDFKEGDFIYLDPPYLISNSEYNKNWTMIDEQNLYDLIDNLDRKKVYFGLSNMLTHKGRKNHLLEKRMKKYYIYEIKSNYISRFNNKIKEDSKEVYITNYEKNRRT
ncbi:Adenine specific DNA methyltransferase [Mycoplasma mycoides subsp. capri LC str. 95010]|uniref:Site-specific DNA-methyltransferase (adenine-specific) n=1 Tax=Mycoplasma mycoides subsp. capri LC str. 95010 TaxID=862259 RepID=F4MNY7_MYCML|nr:Adenine specific DNA methyltransferase [Mycoplasma mycoides subsp. capri LC str. 95010]